VQGERYLTIPDENLMFLAGHYGAPPGPLDPEVVDRAFSTERGKKMLQWSPPQPTLDDIRAQYGRRLSDEELLLRYLIPEPDVDAMYAADAPIEPVFPAAPSRDLGWIKDVIETRGLSALSAARGNVTVELRR
jgi:oxaloacetate decarboxylase alpha subunit